MARRPRVHFSGALYHVISRGNQRQKVYRDHEDYRRFETLLGETNKRHCVTLHAYVVMPNHFYLLLEVSRSPLSKAMQSLLYRYPRYYNQTADQIIQSLARHAESFRRIGYAKLKGLKTIRADRQTGMRRIFHRRKTVRRSRNPLDLDVVRILFYLREIVFHLHAEPHLRA